MILHILSLHLLLSRLAGKVTEYFTTKTLLKLQTNLGWFYHQLSAQ